MYSRRHHILIADRDPTLRDRIAIAVKADGMSADQAGDADLVRAQLARRVPDLLVLDDGLPGIDAFLPPCPDTADRPMGGSSIRIVRPGCLTGSATSCGPEPDLQLPRPGLVRDVIAAIGALLQPTQLPSLGLSATRLSVGRLVLDGEHWEAFFGHTHVPTSATEYRLLTLLASHPSKFFSNDAIAARLGSARDTHLRPAVDGCIFALRSRFRHAGCADLIELLPGPAYRLGTCA